MAKITRLRVRQLLDYVETLANQALSMQAAEEKARFQLRQYVLSSYLISASMPGLDLNLLALSFNSAAEEQDISRDQMHVLGRIAVELKQNPAVLAVSYWPKNIYDNLKSIFGEALFQEAASYYSHHNEKHEPLQIYQAHVGGKRKEAAHVDMSGSTPFTYLHQDDDKRPAARRKLLISLLAIGGAIVGAVAVAALIYFAAPLLPFVGAVGVYVGAHTGIGLSATLLGGGIFAAIGAAIVGTASGLIAFVASRKKSASAGYVALEKGDGAEHVAGVDTLGIYSGVGARPAYEPAPTATRSGKLIVAQPDTRGWQPGVAAAPSAPAPYTPR